MSRTGKRLTLNKNTIRSLDDAALADVLGGRGGVVAHGDTDGPESSPC